MRQKCQCLIYHSGSTYREESGLVSQVSAQAVIGKVTLSMLDIAGLSSASSLAAYVLKAQPVLSFFLPCLQRAEFLYYNLPVPMKSGKVTITTTTAAGLINLKTRK